MIELISNLINDAYKKGIAEYTLPSSKFTDVCNALGKFTYLNDKDYSKFYIKIILDGDKLMIFIMSYY